MTTPTCQILESGIQTLALPAWVRESDNDLRMDMKMMIIESQSLPENIHAVVFINDNHTARLLSEKGIVLPHSTGGSEKLPGKLIAIFWADLQNPVSMIFQHSTFFHSELTDTLFWAWSFILKSAMISQHSHSLATQDGSSAFLTS